ncbi:MAG TPA: cytochrome c oxidase assembly protein [Chloroflexota bacterium]|nr:cytochrome c oxidase assembly protein [Chloroflexota bacterium]
MAPYPPLHTILTAWSFDPQVVLALILLAGVYSAGLREIAQRERFQRLVGTGPIICFALGLLALVLALLSPLDTYDTRSFTVHMAQHLLLLVVAPPLLLLGKPVPVLLLGLPHPLARGIARLHHRTYWLRMVTRMTTAPLGAWLLLTGAVVLWHLPALYGATLTNQGIHLFEHVTFFITALLSWWVIIEPLPGPARLHPGVRLLYSWATMMPMGILGILLTIARGVWYPHYVAQPRLWSLSPLDDQHLGGVLMWVPGGLIYILAISILFFQMMSEEEADLMVQDEGSEPLVDSDARSQQ